MRGLAWLSRKLPHWQSDAVIAELLTRRESAAGAAADARIPGKLVPLGPLVAAAVLAGRLSALRRSPCSPGFLSRNPGLRSAFIETFIWFKSSGRTHRKLSMFHLDEVPVSELALIDNIG